MKKKKKRLPLRTFYYSSFLGLVVVPMLLILIVSLVILNQVFRRQAVENIRRAQEAVASELSLDVEQISMRLSHMVYANDSELLAIAAETDSPDMNTRYQSVQRLNEAASFAAEPVRDIVSMAFYMKNGRSTFFKNDILTPLEEIRQEEWYQRALENRNRVVIGSYDTNDSKLYRDGMRDTLILTAAIAPDGSLDRDRKIEMTAFYQIAGAAQKIKAYNTGYGNGKNKIGYTRIVDGAGRAVYESNAIPENAMGAEGFTRVTTPVEIYGNEWYVESYIRTPELTEDYWDVARLLLVVMAVVLFLYIAFSRYFLNRIIYPVQQISQGMRQVEEGMLDIHLAPAGQYEIRTMIHSFNAMVRRLKALIEGYEERMKHSEKTRSDYLAALVRGEMSPEEVESQTEEFFPEHYVLFMVSMGHEGTGEMRRLPGTKELAAEFDTIPRFASRCFLAAVHPGLYLACYRILEPQYEENLYGMIREMQRLGRMRQGGAGRIELSVCISRPLEGGSGFLNEVQELMKFYDLNALSGEGEILDLHHHYGEYERITAISPSYKKLAAALYIADEKTIGEEREEILNQLQAEDLETAGKRVLAVILATARQFNRSDADFFDIFGQKINYFDKIGRIPDTRSLRLWMANYLSWVTAYSSNRLDVVHTDAVTRAKHYIIEHYQNPNLTLKEVADHVDLNEKYFTSKFTKECGETFLSYLTGLRVQKAKELIKTTTFKMYEISEMVGYNNPEHFNRIFKKSVGMSPAQYRKAP